SVDEIETCEYEDQLADQFRDYFKVCRGYGDQPQGNELKKFVSDLLGLQADFVEISYKYASIRALQKQGLKLTGKHLTSMAWENLVGHASTFRLQTIKQWLIDHSVAGDLVAKGQEYNRPWKQWVWVASAQKSESEQSRSALPPRDETK